jgi:tetratricopeptide (TPR) repeat protein
MSNGFYTLESFIEVSHAQRAVAQGNRLSAINHLNQAIQVNPKNIQAYYLRGLLFYDGRDFEKAYQDLSQVIKLSQTVYKSTQTLYPTALYYRGALYLEQQNNTQGAIEDFSEAIRLNPKFVLAYIQRVNGFIKEGDFQKAIADCEMAIQLEPDNPGGYERRGFIYTYQGAWTDAIADFSEVIRLQPLPGIFYNRGALYSLLEEHQKAIDDLNEALVLDSSFAAAYYVRSNSRYLLGDEEGAIADYELAFPAEAQTAIVAKDHHAYYFRGVVLHRMGESQTALRDLQKAALLCAEFRDNLLDLRVQALIQEIQGLQADG